MFQSLLRNWLLRAAAERMRDAGRPGDPRPGAAAPAAEPEPAAAPRPAVCHVGCVFALSIEAGGLTDRLSGVVHSKGVQFVAREGGLDGRRIVIVECGAGRAAARRGTLALVAGHQPRWVISAGFAGGLRDDLRQGDILMADEIADLTGLRLAIDFKLDPGVLAQTPGLHVGRLLTVDSVVGDPAAKRALGESQGALAVDMESSSVAEVCRDERIRFLSVRVISDAVDRELPPDVDYLIRRKSTLGRLGAATGAIVRRPASVKDLWRLKEDAIAASDRLAKFLSGVIPQLD